MYHNDIIFIECGIEKNNGCKYNTIKLIYDLKMREGEDNIMNAEMDAEYPKSEESADSE